MLEGIWNCVLKVIIWLMCFQVVDDQFVVFGYGKINSDYLKNICNKIVSDYLIIYLKKIFK